MTGLEIGLLAAMFAVFVLLFVCEVHRFRVEREHARRMRGGFDR